MEGHGSSVEGKGGVKTQLHKRHQLSVPASFTSARRGGKSKAGGQSP